MTASTSDSPAAVCGKPVVFPGVFTAVETDLGHDCQRAAGHDGPHRWSPNWEDVAPAQVEAELKADYEKWDKPDDE